MTTADAIILLALAFVAAGMTYAMFLSRNRLLGFPSGLFWAICGGYAYTLSATPWGDWQYYLFFGSMGMVIFSVIGQYALRERPSKRDDEMIDEGEDDTKYIDEDTDETIKRAFYGDEDDGGNLKEDRDNRPTRRSKKRADYGEFS